MKTKIIILLIILILIGGGLFFLSRKEKLPEVTSFSELEVPFISLSSDVEIGELNLDELNIGVSLPSDLFSNISVDSDIGKYEGKIDIGIPTISFDFQSLLKSLKVGSQAPSGPQINEDICLQFKSAPSCSFVPEEYRELCEQCKAKGY